MSTDEKKCADCTSVAQAENESQEAYKELCWILMLMTFSMLIINVIQISLLHITTNRYWIILFPAIVFFLFLVWMTFHFFKRWTYYTGAFSKVSYHLLHHVRNGRDKDDICQEVSSWPKTIGRLGVVLTVICSIVLVEFVFLNTSYIPQWKETTWSMGFRSFTHAKPPALALIHYHDDYRSASLEANTSKIDSLCEWKRDGTTYKDQRCFKNHHNSDNGNYSYVLFNGSDPVDGYHNLTLAGGVDVWYAFGYNGSAADGTGEPNIRLEVFDQDLIDNFQLAYNCGITTTVNLLARNRNTLSIEQYSIHDDLNKMNRPDGCNHAGFKNYKGYNVVLSSLGSEPDGIANSTNCDFTSLKYAGPCYADLYVQFSNLLTTIHTSQRGITQKTIFSDEGGILGYVMTFAWLFDMFAK